MVNGKKPYRRRPAAKRPFKRTARKSVKPSKALTKAVQKIIHKDAENKMAFHSVDSLLFNSGINSTGDQQRCLPNVGTGSEDYQRIGSNIRAQSLNIKGHYILSTANNSIANTRLAVRMMVVQPKNLTSWPDASATTSWLSNLLRKGAATTAFTGVISDLYASINSDQITTYYDKVTYVTMPYLYTSTLGIPTTGYSVTSWDLVNSTRFFNINLKVKNKLLKYEPNFSGVQPTSYAPILLLGYVHLDGSSPDVSTTQVALSYVSNLSFEDM